MHESSNLHRSLASNQQTSGYSVVRQGAFILGGKCHCGTTGFTKQSLNLTNFAHPLYLAALLINAILHKQCMGESNHCAIIEQLLKQDRNQPVSTIGSRLGIKCLLPGLNLLAFSGMICSISYYVNGTNTKTSKQFLRIIINDGLFWGDPAPCYSHATLKNDFYHILAAIWMTMAITGNFSIS